MIIHQATKNDAESVRAVAHSVGYKFGEWPDVGSWELTLREREPHPQEPIGIHEIPLTIWES